MASVQNITIDQGATFSLDLALTNDDGTAKDLTNYTVASQMRKSYDATTYTAFTVVKVNATGAITLSLTATETAALKAGRYVYDVECDGSDPVETLRVVEGLVNVTPNVTKS